MLSGNEAKLETNKQLRFKIKNIVSLNCVTFY